MIVDVMASPRALTTVAILAGGGLGAAAALIGRTTPPSAERGPYRPVATIARTVSASPVAPDNLGTVPSTTASIAAPKNSAPPIAPLDDVPSDPSALKASEVACARGNPEACLRAGNGHAVTRGDRALAFRRRAVVLYEDRCYNRDPKSCGALSALYRRGMGVERNARAAEALAKRFDELCRQNPTPSCKNR